MSCFKGLPVTRGIESFTGKNESNPSIATPGRKTVTERIWVRRPTKVKTERFIYMDAAQIERLVAHSLQHLLEATGSLFLSQLPNESEKAGHLGSGSLLGTDGLSRIPGVSNSENVLHNRPGNVALHSPVKA